MRNSFFLFLLLSLSPLVTAKEVIGVWELVSGEYINGEGKLVDYKEIKLHSMKVISSSHFSFTSMKGEEFWASGTGSYEFADGKYIEKLHYNSFGQNPGATFIFDSKIDDDYWYNSRWKGDKRVEHEVWRRVE
ncbi:hypothetical protein [Microbulbifer taiwanensis]